jgi:hypothetical protein
MLECKIEWAKMRIIDFMDRGILFTSILLWYVVRKGKVLLI